MKCLPCRRGRYLWKVKFFMGKTTFVESVSIYINPINGQSYISDLTIKFVSDLKHLEIIFDPKFNSFFNSKIITNKSTYNLGVLIIHF